MFHSSTQILAKSVGRRKEAVAQVQMVKGTGQFVINNKPAQVYLQNNSSSILTIKSPFETLQNETTISPGSPGEEIIETNTLIKQETVSSIDTFVKVQGGGLLGQAEAIKLAVARALCQLEKESETVPPIRASLKSKGYLTSDSRIKERRKYGLKKARKASQYHKR
jgi:small subunit ribosomal protein S9